MSTLECRSCTGKGVAQTHRTDRSVLAAAQNFVKQKAFYPEPCRHFRPSITKLQSTTFSDYIRSTVLRKSERGYDSDYDEVDDDDQDDDETEVVSGESEEENREFSNDNTSTERNNTSDDATNSQSTTTAAAVETSINHHNELPNPTTTTENPSIPTATRSSKRISIRNSTGRNDNAHSPKHIHTHSEKYDPNKPITYYDYGIAKISLPDGFSKLEGIAKDQTGRGQMWQAGTELGDRTVLNHKQVVRGIGGIYEYTFFEQDALTVAEFRTKADEYMKSQLGNHMDQPVEVLERKFWKRIGPTMQPALYGADMEGTCFSEDDDCHGFNVSKLRSCLQLLLMDQEDDESKGIPGVTTPYLYFGMWASVFCAHTEDMNLLSINYLHAGAPKIWYAVPAGEDAKRFEEVMASSYHHAKQNCPEYLRHKRSLISPAMLRKAGIPFTRTVQYPGDAIITFPGSYHFGFNTGFNVAEATNFAVPEWIPYGRQAKVCLCRPDSVRIDMNKFEQLLLQYEKEVLQSKRFAWAEWVTRTKKKRVQEEIANASYGSSPNKASKSEKADTLKRTRDFWIEVVQPAKKSKLSSSKKKNTKKKVEKKQTEIRKAGKDAPKSAWEQEVWHLAKPVGRKSLQPSSRVLCIVPAVVTNDGKSKSRGTTNNDRSENDDGDDGDDEQCFAGSIVEIHEEHVRIRLDGMNKSDDIWMEASSPKLFADGGRWEEDPDFKMPKLHYWKLEDSRDVLV